jgi:hypothetical protein
VLEAGDGGRGSVDMDVVVGAVEREECEELRACLGRGSWTWFRSIGKVI